MRILFILTLLTSFITSCKEASQVISQGSTSISGTMPEIQVSKVALQQVFSSTIKDVDSIEIAEDGTFDFSFSPTDTIGLYRLSTNPNNFMILVIKKGDQLKLNVEGNTFDQAYTVEGSPESNRIKEFNNISLEAYQKFGALNNKITTAQQQNNYELLQSGLQERAVLLAELTNQTKDFIRVDPGSMASFIALQRLDLDADFETFKLVSDSLYSKYPSNSFAKELKTRISSMANLNVGSQAPEIVMNTPSGESFALSSLRGKYVLIDFWASWCQPCRMENPNVVRVYNNYKNKGFDILSVSLDKTKEAWEKAIEEDGLRWNHVSDLGFWQSAIVPVYNINSIPMTFLVDPNGVIIAKNLRGEALENKLAELLP